MQTLHMKGRIKAEIFRDGKLIDSSGWVNNIITNVGKAQVALLTGSAGTAFGWLAVGTSNTAVNASDTALGAEVSTSGLGRAAATITQLTTTTTNDTVQFFHQWTASGSVSVQEVGVFNAASVGIMLEHALTGTKSVVSGDILQMTVQVQFT